MAEENNQSSVSDDTQRVADTTPQRGTPNEEAASQRETAGDDTIRDPEKKRLHEEAVSHKLRAKQLEAQLKVYQDAEQQAEDAKRSEIERVKKQHSDTEARYNAISLELKEERVFSAVYRYAPKMNFILSPERIAQFITRSDVEFDEQGKPTNIEKLLTALAKSEPDLVKKIEDPPAPTPKPNAPALPPGNPGRSSIAPPSSLPSGTRPSLAEAYRLAKK